MEHDDTGPVLGMSHDGHCLQQVDGGRQGRHDVGTGVTRPHPQSRQSAREPNVADDVTGSARDQQQERIDAIGDEGTGCEDREGDVLFCINKSISPRGLQNQHPTRLMRLRMIVTCGVDQVVIGGHLW